MIETNSSYKKLPSKKATYMTAAEMGRLLGLKKTERYWLLHKQYFEWEEIMGKIRINIASFEKWYANQVKYKKVTGEEPGLELKERTFSPKEIAKLLGICESSAYDVINANNIEIEIVDHWKRIPKDAFYKWYYSQTKYRTQEDRERDLAIESTTISMPEMARLLGVERSTVYSILKSSKYKDLFEIVIVAEQKRITMESFERFLAVQNQYSLDEYKASAEKSIENNMPSASDYKQIFVDSQSSLNNKDKQYLTYQEATQIAKVSRATIYENKKTVVIYGYKDENGKRKQKWETFDSETDAYKRKKEIEYKTACGMVVIHRSKCFQ